MKSKSVLTMIAVSSLVLGACSNGGGSDDVDEGIVYTGSKSPATVTGANAANLAIAGTGGATQAIAADSANNANPLTPKGATTGSNLAATVIAQLQTAAAAQAKTAAQPLAICDAGSAELDQNGNGTQGSIVFSNCLVTGGNGAVLNGTVTFKATVSGTTVTALDLRLVNFTVTYQGESHTVNMTVACSGAPLSCDVFSDFVGLDGKIYRVELTLVVNTVGSSFAVDAVVYHPDHGYVTIDASISYDDCPGGVPQAGSIALTGVAASSAAVVFNDCDSFTVTHQGVPTTYQWVNIL